MKNGLSSMQGMSRNLINDDDQVEFNNNNDVITESAKSIKNVQLNLEGIDEVYSINGEPLNTLRIAMGVPSAKPDHDLSPVSLKVEQKRKLLEMYHNRDMLCPKLYKLKNCNKSGYDYGLKVFKKT